MKGFLNLLKDHIPKDLHCRRSLKRGTTKKPLEDGQDPNPSTSHSQHHSDDHWLMNVSVPYMGSLSRATTLFFLHVYMLYSTRIFYQHLRHNKFKAKSPCPTNYPLLLCPILRTKQEFGPSWFPPFLWSIPEPRWALHSRCRFLARSSFSCLPIRTCALLFILTTTFCHGPDPDQES